MERRRAETRWRDEPPALSVGRVVSSPAGWSAGGATTRRLNVSQATGSSRGSAATEVLPGARRKGSGTPVLVLVPAVPAPPPKGVPAPPPVGFAVPYRAGR